MSLYSAGCGVKSVAVVLSGFMDRLFSLAQLVTVFMYGCNLSRAVLWSWWLVVIVMSSAYVISCVCSGGEGISEVYMLNSVGERTPPCGTPVLMSRVFEGVLL